MSLINKLTRSMAAACAATLLISAACSNATAGLIEIDFTGVDIEYDSGTGEITTVGGADALNAVSVTLDNVAVTGSPFGSGTIELVIPGVTGIAADSPFPGGFASTVTSAPGGSLDLIFSTGSISLTLDEVAVTYVNTDGAGTLEFVFGGGTGGVDSQLLPDGLIIEDEVAISFTTTVDPGSLTDDGALAPLVTGFTANGAGTFDGLAVPEPGALIIALISLVGFAAARMRYRLG